MIIPSNVQRADVTPSVTLEKSKEKGDLDYPALGINN
jgi:hypothetical protein